MEGAAPRAQCGIERGAPANATARWPISSDAVNG
jgi:hypothetical protein